MLAKKNESIEIVLKGKSLPPDETPPLPSSISTQTNTTTDIKPNAIPPICVRRYLHRKNVHERTRIIGIEKQSNN